MLLDRSRMLLAGLAVFLTLGGTASAVTEVVTASPAAADSHACTNSISVGISPTIDEGTSPGTPAPTNLTARVGDSIVYTLTARTGAQNCPFHTGTLTITFPSGTTDTVATALVLTPSTSVTFTSSKYVVAQTDVGRKTDPLIGTTPAAGNVQAFAQIVGKTTKPTGETQSASGTADYTVPVIHPETTLTKTPSVTTGTPPLAVTYTFAETNVSTAADPATLLTLDVITTVALTDTGCTPAFTRSSDGTDTTLKPGATWTYTCAVTYPTTGTFTDHASATGTAGDGRPAGTPASFGAPQSEAASATVVVKTSSPSTSGTPLLRVVKSSTPPSGSLVSRSASVTYTLTLTNSGTAAATAVTVTDAVPVGTTYTATSASCNGLSGCTASESGGTVTWTGITVAAGTSVTIHFGVVVDATDTNGQVIDNHAVFTNEHTPTCTGATCTTNTVTLHVEVPAPPPPTRISLATTVHTGEPWGGALWPELGVLGAGLGLVVVGDRMRRRRRPKHAA